MFKHTGTNRTYQHNLNIASLLSFVAGFVNVIGFLSVHKLTTNVTGHFAFFVDEVFKWNLWNGFVYFLYVFSFLLGSFFSNTLVEWGSIFKQKNVYRTPILVECLILFIVAVVGKELILYSADILAFLLLFAMGLQNSLVTMISNSTVRTTHLTGLFTDLGIELSQLFFYKLKEQKEKLISIIKLRLTIIFCFFVGGVTGGTFFSILDVSALGIATIVLIFGLVYDEIKFNQN